MKFKCPPRDVVELVLERLDFLVVFQWLDTIVIRCCYTIRLLACSIDTMIRSPGPYKSVESEL
jgi:hypothetical protein